MARHARGAQPVAVENAPAQEPVGRAGRRRAQAARQKRRRTGGLLAICATALAAGAGGVVSGVLPAPDAAVVAGDLTLGGLPAAGHDAAGDGPSAGSAAPSATAGALRADASPAADRGEARSPLASPSATATTTAAVPAVPAVSVSSPAPAPTPSSSATTKAPATTTANKKAASSAAAVLALVNEQRALAGCSPVRADARLDTLAKAFSDDMAARGFFDHTDPDGRTPWDRAKTAGISNLGGENIARGQATPEAVMTAWMNSPGHRANILNCKFTTLGVGVHEGSGGPWWTQDFGF